MSDSWSTCPSYEAPLTESQGYKALIDSREDKVGAKWLLVTGNNVKTMFLCLPEHFGMSHTAMDFGEQ